MFFLLSDQKVIYQVPLFSDHQNCATLFEREDEDSECCANAMALPGPDTLNGAFDHLEDTNFGDMGPQDRETHQEACVQEEQAHIEEVKAYVEDTHFRNIGPEDREEEEEACIEDTIPENFDAPR